MIIAWAAPALAGTLNLGAQYSCPTGQTNFWTGLSGGGCSTPGQCLPFAGRLLDCKGTQTIKASKIELLARIVCGGAVTDAVWQGHQYDRGGGAPDTVHIDTPSLPADAALSSGGNCWIEYQVINPLAATPPNACFEIQATCSFQ
jgi:hypothetical protein